VIAIAENPTKRSKVNFFNFEKSLGHLTILFNRPPRPEACWSSRSKDYCEELIHPAVAHRDPGLNPGSHDREPNAFIAEHISKILPFVRINSMTFLDALEAAK